MTQATLPLKFVSSNRRVREDRRFVAGQGRFVADVPLEGLLHVALVASQYPAARIVSIDVTEAMKMPGVHYALTGEELARATDPLMNGLDTPNVRRFPLAVDQVRYAGEWVVAVVAETRAQAEDAAEKIRVEYLRLPYVIDGEQALDPSSPPVHAAHGSNVLLDRTFVWGDVEQHFAESPRHLAFRVTWGRSSTVPIETFGVAAQWDPWREILDVWASIQMPKYPDQIARALRIPLNNVRVHQDVDVGGSYGVKRGIKQTVLVAHLARTLGRPVRLIEDRLENMRWRRPRAGPHLRRRSGVQRRRHRQIDEDARARQCRCLRRSFPVPTRQADRRHRWSLQDPERAISRRRSHLEQGCAGGGARLRTGADQLCDRDRDRQGRGRARA